MTKLRCVLSRVKEQGRKEAAKKERRGAQSEKSRSQTETDKTRIKTVKDVWRSWGEREKQETKYPDDPLTFCSHQSAMQWFLVSLPFSFLLENFSQEVVVMSFILSSSSSPPSSSRLSFSFKCFNNLCNLNVYQSYVLNIQFLFWWQTCIQVNLQE